ncbi:hypothetical protein U9M48_033559 [Paspalum notatum var. saurae]|uniref:Uncharacterized protein n=1 Tax=Paspalum notatum var. saurae TaxID=547442 RepID=A0AAQ3U7S1_PASNO
MATTSRHHPDRGCLKAKLMSNRLLPPPSDEERSSFPEKRVAEKTLEKYLGGGMRLRRLGLLVGGRRHEAPAGEIGRLPIKALRWRLGVVGDGRKACALRGL